MFKKEKTITLTITKKGLVNINCSDDITFDEISISADFLGLYKSQRAEKQCPVEINPDKRPRVSARKETAKWKIT